MPVTATERYYKLMSREYPEAFEVPALWNLLGYLARGWYVHRDRRRLQLPYALLAGLAVKATPRVLGRETYPEGEVLLLAVREVLGRDDRGRWRFEWSEAWTGRQPRLVKRLEWPSKVRRAIEQERRTAPWDGAPRVYWTARTAAGKPRRFDLRTHTAKTNEELDALAASLRVGAHPVTEVNEVLDMLHGTPPNTLSSLIKSNMARAYRAVEKLRDDLRERADDEHNAKARRALCKKGDRLYDHQMRCLEAIKESSRPRYFVPANSPRLFPVSDHLTGLKADVRRTLLAGLIELDLASAHLAILATILDLPTVTAFLESGASVWDYLFKELGLASAVKHHPELGRRLKAVLKQEGLYPALYGRERGYLVRRVNEATAEACSGTRYVGPRKISDLGQRFADHPMIAEILGATATKLGEIEALGTVLDVDGHVIALPTAREDVGLSEGVVKLSERGTAKTALCYCASVVELKLLHAVVGLQKRQSGSRFQILLWQHDGVSVHVKDVRRTVSVIREVQQAVAEEASRLGVHTRLEVEPASLPKGVIA